MAAKIVVLEMPVTQKAMAIISVRRVSTGLWAM